MTAVENDVERPDDEGDGSDGGDARAPSRWRYSARVAVVGLAVATALTAVVAGRDWLGGGRAALITVLALAVAGLLVWADRRRPAAVAAALAAAVVGLTATELGQQDSDFARRVLGDDLPPAAVYTVAVLAGVVLLGALALAVTARPRPNPAGPPDRGAVAVAVGGVALVVVLAGAAAAGTGARSLADRAAEDDALIHTLSRPAAAQPDRTGPDEAAEPVWEAEIAHDTPVDESRGRFVSSVVVPGWDVVLGTLQDDLLHRKSLVALSATDGEELWRYERQGQFGFTVTVDPGTGRVLLVREDAAVVLDLEDGELLTTRRLPGDPGCRANLGNERTRTDLHDTNVGAIAVLGCEAGVVTVAVADATVLATTRDVVDGIGCDLLADHARPRPLLLRWGTGCGAPTLLGLDPEGTVVQVAEITPPGGAGGECPMCEFDLVSGTGLVEADDDLVVASIGWPEADPPGGLNDNEVAVTTRELIALAPDDGAERWRAPVATDTTLVGVTPAGVVVRDGTTWRLLALDDGHELAQSPRLPEEDQDSVAATDGALLYSAGATVTTRRVDDLSLVGSHPGRGLPFDRRVYAQGDLLIFRDGWTHLVAFGEPGT